MEAFLRAVAREYSGRESGMARDVASHLKRIAASPVTFTPNAGSGIAPLAQALAAANQHTLTAHLAPVANDLDWRTGENFPMPASFKGRFAYCEIAGPEGMIAAEGFRFGTYIQHPDTWYPIHSHAAEELYFIASGTAEWTRNGVKGQPEPPGALIHHAPHEGHATQTRAEALLALWAWVGDITISDYRIEDE